MSVMVTFTDDAGNGESVPNFPKGLAAPREITIAPEHQRVGAGLGGFVFSLTRAATTADVTRLRLEGTLRGLTVGTGTFSPGSRSERAVAAGTPKPDSGSDSAPGLPGRILRRGFTPKPAGAGC